MRLRGIWQWSSALPRTCRSATASGDRSFWNLANSNRSAARTRPRTPNWPPRIAGNAWRCTVPSNAAAGTSRTPGICTRRWSAHAQSVVHCCTLDDGNYSLAVFWRWHEFQPECLWCFCGQMQWTWVSHYVATVFRNVQETFGNFFGGIFFHSRCCNKRYYLVGKASVLIVCFAGDPKYTLNKFNELVTQWPTLDKKKPTLNVIFRSFLSFFSRHLFSCSPFDLLASSLCFSTVSKIHTNDHFRNQHYSFIKICEFIEDAIFFGDFSRIRLANTWNMFTCSCQSNMMAQCAIAVQYKKRNYFAQRIKKKRMKTMSELN